MISHVRGLKLRERFCVSADSKDGSIGESKSAHFQRGELIAGTVNSSRKEATKVKVIQVENIQSQVGEMRD